MPSAYLFFHCNLEFSSIPVADRSLVVDRCYQAILHIARELNIPVGIELSGQTLEHIATINPSWLEDFRQLLDQGKCELIASGYAQIIGPLVPAEVTRRNLQLGLEIYQHLLQHRPRLALINEMAFSSGLLDLYLEAGFKGVIVDRRNLPFPNCPTAIASASGQKVPLLWADSILFQRLQRYVHGELGQEQYLDHLAMISAKYPGPIPLYSSDGEIFDYRPARFHSEAHLQGEEWPRLFRMLILLSQEKNFYWLSPSQAFAELQLITSEAPSITTAKMPIPCKKQAKYQVSRWAISGRNDLWLNTCCFRFFAALSSNPALRHHRDAWRLLCSFWGSDYRTHIEEQRWQMLLQAIAAAADRWQVDLPPRAKRGSTASPACYELDLKTRNAVTLPSFIEKLAFNREGTLVEIRSSQLSLTLNIKRGLAIERLAFRSHQWTPLLGSIPQGYFDDITFGVDYYSASTVIELPRSARKLTDLVATTPRFSYREDALFITTSICTDLGTIEKTYCLSNNEEALSLTTNFANSLRPLGSVRLNTLTLLPEYWGEGVVSVSTRNGGDHQESFPLCEDVRHDQAINSIVSNTTAMGASDGRIVFHNSSRGLAVHWDPSNAAALPLLIHQLAAPSHLTRLVFSLAELDETSREGGRLLDFTVIFKPL